MTMMVSVEAICVHFMSKERLLCSRQHSMNQKIRLRDWSLRQVRDEHDLEPSPAERAPSTTGLDPQVMVTSETHFNNLLTRLSEYPIPTQRMCSLETACVHGETMASARDKRRGRVLSREDENIERDAEAFG